MEEGKTCYGNGGSGGLINISIHTRGIGRDSKVLDRVYHSRTMRQQTTSSCYCDSVDARRTITGQVRGPRLAEKDTGNSKRAS